MTVYALWLVAASDAASPSGDNNTAARPSGDNTAHLNPSGGNATPAPATGGGTSDEGGWSAGIVAGAVGAVGVVALLGGAWVWRRCRRREPVLASSRRASDVAPQLCEVVSQTGGHVVFARAVVPPLPRAPPHRLPPLPPTLPPPLLCRALQADFRAVVVDVHPVAAGPAEDRAGEGGKGRSSGRWTMTTSRRCSFRFCRCFELPT